MNPCQPKKGKIDERGFRFMQGFMKSETQQIFLIFLLVFYSSRDRLKSAIHFYAKKMLFYSQWKYICRTFWQMKGFGSRQSPGWNSSVPLSYTRHLPTSWIRVSCPKFGHPSKLWTLTECLKKNVLGDQSLNYG